MIPRKKIRSLIRTICIFYAFGYGGGRALANGTESTESTINDYSELSSNTILHDDYPISSSPEYPDYHHTVGEYSRSERISDSITTSESTISSDETSFSNTNTDEPTTEAFVCKDIPSSVENLTISSTSSTLVVTWGTPTSVDECISFYDVTWYPNNLNYSGYKAVNSTETNLTISDLTPCTNYNISVIAVGENGGKSKTVTVSSCTEESQISQVNKLLVSGIEYGLNVTWDPPEDITCLKSYRINVATEDNVTHLANTDPSADTFYKFSNLSACTKYSVQVIPIGIKGDYGTVALASNQETLASVPGAVINLTAPSDKITENSVYLTWLPPNENQNCVLHYNVSICYEDNCTTDTTIEEFYNATSLDPCLTYKFTVSAVGDAGSSDEATTNAQTLDIKIGPVTNFEIKPGPHSLFIHWKVPVIGHTCLKHYRIVLWSAGETETTIDTNITMDNLISCKDYTVQVTPISIKNDQDGDFVSRSATTDKSVNNPPSAVIGEEKTVTKSTISTVWSIDRTMNECGLKNLITSCNFISTNGHGFDFLNGRYVYDISSLNSSNDTTINVTVSDLSPFSTYECYAITENVAGYSSNSSLVEARTFEDVPSAPTMEASSIGSTAFKLVWRAPQYLAGNLIEHEISLSWEEQFLKPSFCDYGNSSSSTILNANGPTFEYQYSEAKAYTMYNASIRSKTNADWGNYSDFITFQTSADVPGAVTNITYSDERNPDNSDLLDTFLSWQLPCSLNGEIESFHIHFNGKRDPYPEHIGDLNYSDFKDINGDTIFTKELGELKAEYEYTFRIYVQVYGVSELSEPNSYSVIYPAGIPPEPEEWYMSEITIDVHRAIRNSSTAWILLPLFHDTNGEIMYYAIMISEYGVNNSTQSRFDMKSENWPNTISWHEAISHNPIITYQATPIRWFPNENDIIANSEGVKAVKFMLGGDESCSKLSTDSYCNGPLKPDTMYSIVMRAFTNGGYRDSPLIFAKTKAEFNLGMVIGVVFGILFFGIITTLMLRVRKGVLHTVLGNILNSSIQSSPGPEPLTRKKFQVHCQELIENPGKLSNEFQLLQTLSVDLEMAATAATLQANRRKNRYINILPYDISRVKLDLLNNDPNSDYINASLIPGYSGSTEYIACQGPKEETTYDFWRMVFQYDIKIIAMVTQLVEKGKDKCHQYYPNTRQNFEYEDITIRCSTQLDFVFYTQRIITLQKGDVEKTIMHLHFKEWSDHGVPDDIHTMINFCQVVRKLMNDNKSLAVVHCSAGVGRTGTLIAIDILLQQIKDNKKLDVFGTVYRLRQHRMNMVQTESQYAYIYNCAKQALSHPYPSKHYMTSTVEPVYENNTEKKKNVLIDSNTNLVNSAETIKKISPSLSTVSMEPIAEILRAQRPVYTTQLSTLSTGNNTGLRYSKSTSAINTQIPSNLQLDRYASQDYPIFEPAPESPSGRSSTDRTSFLEFTRPIRFETRITRATSINDDESTDLSIYGIKPTY